MTTKLLWKVDLYDSHPKGPLAVEVLEGDEHSATIKELDTGAVYRQRRSDQVFESFDAAKSVLLDFQLLQIEFAELKLKHARERLRTLVAMREPRHD